MWNLLFYFGLFGTIIFSGATITETIKGNFEDLVIGVSTTIVFGILPATIGFINNKKRKKQLEEQRKNEQLNSILRLARANQGILTISEVSLELNISIDEAKRRLEEAITKGICIANVNENGNIEYHFPDLLNN